MFQRLCALCERRTTAHNDANTTIPRVMRRAGSERAMDDALETTPHNR